MGELNTVCYCLSLEKKGHNVLLIVLRALGKHQSCVSHKLPFGEANSRSDLRGSSFDLHTGQ